MDKYQVVGVGCAHVSLFVLKTFMCREELGLSARNIIIALVSSSLLLGLFLLFIFIGIGIFSDGSDPFAAIVNAGLTLSAGLGNFRFAFSAICWRRCPFSFASAYSLFVATSLYFEPRHDRVLQESTSATKTTTKEAAILHLTKLSPIF